MCRATVDSFKEGKTSYNIRWSFCDPLYIRESLINTSMIILSHVSYGQTRDRVTFARTVDTNHAIIMAFSTPRKKPSPNFPTIHTINKEVLLRTLVERLHVSIAAKMVKIFSDEASQAKLLGPTSGGSSNRLGGRNMSHRGRPRKANVE